MQHHWLSNFRTHSRPLFLALTTEANMEFKGTEGKWEIMMDGDEIKIIEQTLLKMAQAGVRILQSVRKFKALKMPI